MKKAAAIAQMGRLIVINVPYDSEVVGMIMGGHGQEAFVEVIDCGGGCFALSIYPQVELGDFGGPTPGEVILRVLNYVWSVLRFLDLVAEDEMPEVLAGDINAVF